LAISSIEEPKTDNPFTQGLCLPVLIDADIITYRAAFSPDSVCKQSCQAKVDDVVDFIKHHTSVVDVGQYEFHLTGKGNFRKDIAVTAEYKANRKGKERPIWLDTARDYLISTYDAIVSEGQECDDVVAIRATEMNYNCIAASVDKDFLQIPCWHYNFGRNEWYKPEPFEATRFFYQQILHGDSTDNIIGLWKVGPVKAAKLLVDCTTEKELYEAVLLSYDNNEDRVLENARLLWLRRYYGEMWIPPT
jgi:hypothetical protein